MTHTNFPRVLEEVISNYPFEGELIHCTPFGSGHINDTYLLTYRISKQEKKRYVLQKINTTAFKKPVELMENMINITKHLRKRSGNKAVIPIGRPSPPSVPTMVIPTTGTAVDTFGGLYCISPIPPAMTL